MKTWKKVLVGLLVVIGILAGIVLNAAFGNPISKSIAQRKALAYFEDTYQTSFVVYDSYYNFKMTDYVFEMGPEDDPTIRFDTFLFVQDITDPYGGILSSKKLKEDVRALFEGIYDDLIASIHVFEDPLTGYPNEQPDYFETDPTKRVLKNHHLMIISLWDDRITPQDMIEIRLDMIWNIEMRLPYQTPNLMVDIKPSSRPSGLALIDYEHIPDDVTQADLDRIVHLFKTW